MFERDYTIRRRSAVDPERTLGFIGVKHDIQVMRPRWDGTGRRKLKHYKTARGCARVVEWLLRYYRRHARVLPDTQIIVCIKLPHGVAEIDAQRFLDGHFPVAMLNLTEVDPRSKL